MACSLFQSVRRVSVPKKRIIECANFVLKKEGYVHADVSVHLIGTKRMISLNYAHRGKMKPTDVLSFAVDTSANPNTVTDLGDIFLCIPYIESQAASLNVECSEELLRMLIHGLLHCMGYDHMKKRDAQEMFSLQERYLSRCA